MKRLVLPLLLLSTPVLAGNYLTEEMEILRRDLGPDDPSLRELTLRLADLYFDISIKDDPENRSISEDREKALALYQDTLKGAHGFAPLEGETRLKVLFQTARLQDKLGRKDKAEVLFLELRSAASVPRNLKLEAALYLGEFNEDKARLKEAAAFYQEAISLCTSVDTCNFAHYRLGWTWFKETKLDEAIKEIYLSLWDAKGNLRDQAVNDLISFMSQRQTDGKKELKEIELIIEKSKNSGLMNQLGETFYLAGNREAGSLVLTHINKKTPSLYNEVRLLEESYGFRKWDEVDSYLKVLSRRSSKDLPVVAEEKDEALKIHRRLIVQLDAESETNPERTDYLKRAIDLYLDFYPADEMKVKMQEGWLKAEADANVKIKRLGQWITDANAQDASKLRRTRLSLAQKQNDSEVVIIEARALAAMTENTAERREYEYVAAYELNKGKKTLEAEGIFKKLVSESLDKNFSDQWMIQSQNLLLDNFNLRKDFAAIIESVNLWSDHPSFKDRIELKDEFASMRVIATQAGFEKAVAAGESKDSLEHFFENCLQGVLVPQSCENAKVLSVKLKDQAKLVTLLEMSKDEASLVNEYELMGRFGDAARLWERTDLKGRPTITQYLKVALLYELDLNFKERNRVLSDMVSSLKSGKIDPKFERVLYATLMEAGMIDAGTLSLGWSLPYKMKLAQQIENGQTRKMLLSEKTYQGPVWSKVVLDEIQNLDDAQRKISFYGGNSKVMFKKKVDMVSRFEKELNSYLQGADSTTRVYLLTMAQKSNKDFADGIINTPIPADLEAGMVEQIKAHLTELASAYYKGAQDYEKLFTDELAAMEDKELMSKVSANLDVTDARYSSFIEQSGEAAIRTAGIDYKNRSGYLLKLSSEPTSADALAALEKFYTTNKSERMASYFKERIRRLQH